MVTPEMLDEATGMMQWLISTGWIWVIGGAAVLIVIVVAGLIWDAVKRSE